MTGIEFAPLHVPWRRRLQMIFIIMYTMLLWSFYVFVFISYLLVRNGLWWIPALYIAFMIYDRETPWKGGRSLDWIRGWKSWQNLRDYFPMTLHKTADLDPGKNYVLGYHPHGVLVTGVTGNISLNTSHLRQIFPGLTWRICTLNFFFYVPFMRELFLTFGLVPVSRESIRHVLTKCGDRGNALVIVVGGAQEALDAQPSNAVLKLKNRMGFVKMAMQTGADLVPIYSFGENDIFTLISPKDSYWRKFQELCKRITSMPPVFFFGRGIFNYSFGGLPHRRPIHTIVGAPIVVTQTIEPTKEQVAALHGKYVEALTRLFDEHKTKYGYDKSAKLIIY